MARLDGKTAIITAVGQGIGRATALAFAGEGARVIAMDPNSDPLGSLPKEAETDTHILDVTNSDAVTAFAGGIGAVDHVAGDCVVNDVSERDFRPGDIISTGTPPGVGMGQSPQIYLKAGDVVELSVEGLGSQKQNVIAAH